MAESPGSGGGKPTPLIRVGIVAGLVGAAMAAGAVTDMVHARNGAFAWDIVILFGAVLALGVSGYLFWGYRYLSRRPQLRPGTPEGDRRLSERRHASACVKWRHRHRRAIMVAGSVLSVSLVGYSVFLIASGGSGAFPIALAVIIMFAWWRLTVGHTNDGRPLNGGEEGDTRD